MDGPAMWAGRPAGMQGWTVESGMRLNRRLNLCVIVGDGAHAAGLAMSGSEGCDDSVSWKP